jgi:hypothetical protein
MMQLSIYIKMQCHRTRLLPKWQDHILDDSLRRPVIIFPIANL